MTNGIPTFVLLPPLHLTHPHFEKNMSEGPRFFRAFIDIASSCTESLRSACASFGRFLMFTDKFFSIAQFGHEITLWVLIVLSIFSLAFIFERLLSLSRVLNQSRKISGRLREALTSNQFQEIEDLARDKETLEGRVLSYAFRHIKENGEKGLSEIFQAYASMERPHMEKHLNFLATVGSNAPFIGLLGTVFGIMDAFRGLATSQGDASAVMIGISKALVATAVGLMVAIPAIIAYNYFQRQVRSILTSLEAVKDLALVFAKSNKKS